MSRSTPPPPLQPSDSGRKHLAKTRITAAALLAMLGALALNSALPEASAQNARAPARAPAMPAVQPSEAEIQREIERQRKLLDELRLKADAAQLGVGSAVVPPRRGPSLTDEEIASAQGDPAQLANLFREVERGETHQDASPVMMFASTSMPHESLLAMARDSRRAGVPIYLKGLPHGMTGPALQRSLLALKPYVEAGADLQVHPELFEYYKVTVVPAVVVTSQPKTGCTDASCAANYVKVLGDVSLPYALDHVAPRRDEIGQAARTARAKLQPSR